jgi:hypothetical protein
MKAEVNNDEMVIIHRLEPSDCQLLLEYLLGLFDEIKSRFMLLGFDEELIK